MRSLTSSTPGRRASGLAVAAALALTTVSLTASPASAAAFTGFAQASNSFSTAGGSSCSITSGGNGSDSSPLNSPGSVHFTGNDSAVATDSGDPTDVTNMAASYDARAALTEAGGAVKTLDMVSTLSTSVEPTQGPATSCDSAASSSFVTVGSLNVPSASILDLTIKIRGSSSANWTFVLSKTTGPPGSTVQVDTNQNGKTRRVLSIPPGTYSWTAVATNTLGEPDAASDPTSNTVRINAHGVFSRPGSALGATKGTGTKYLKLPNVLNCAAHSVKARFTRAAGQKATPANGVTPKINKAKFYVNGHKVATKLKPYKGLKVKLVGLDVTDEVVVEVLMTLHNGSKVDVRRTYLPCS
jgi:hypothetical protein